MTTTRQHPTFKPWVGPEYTSEGIADVRVLIVGKSYYGDPGGEDDETSQKVIEQVGPEEREALFTTTAKLVLGMSERESLSDEIRSWFWDHVAYYSYLQTVPGPTATNEPAAQAWEDAEEPFREVVDDLEPHALLVLGKDLGEHLPDLETHDLETCVVHHPRDDKFDYAVWRPLVRDMITTAQEALDDD
jgi:hypothetical protein